MNSLDRVYLDVVLTTRSALHVGTGRALRMRLTPDASGGSRAAAREDEEADDIVEVAEQACGMGPRAMIPSSSFRGCLRAAAERCARAGVFELSDVASLFGHLESAGSRLEVSDLRDDTSPRLMPSIQQFWDEARGTCIQTSVSVDPWTGTAVDGALFQVEVIPEGSQLGGGLLIRRCQEVDLRIVAAAIHGIEIGLDCLGANSGEWGQCSVRIANQKRLTGPLMQGWFESGATKPVASCAVPEEAYRLDEATREQVRRSRSMVKAEIELTFLDGMLVRDPSRAKLDDGTDTRPVMTAGGHVVLAPSGVRGALRQQARRIANSLYPTACGAACAGSDPLQLCPVCLLFGTTSWARCLHVSQCRSAPNQALLPRQRNAIDRFVGGVAGRRLFGILCTRECKLEGVVRLDLDRLVAGDETTVQRAICLLVFLARDVAEGDVHFGGFSGLSLGWPTARVLSASAVAPSSGKGGKAVAALCELLNDSRSLKAREPWADYLEVANG